MSPDTNWQTKTKNVLRGSQVFGQLDASVLDELVQNLSYSPVPGGTQVLREGDASNSVIIVISGRLRIWREGPDGTYMRYNEIGPGESIGEAGMILHQNRTANVTALRDSLLAVLSRDAYETLLKRRPLAINRVFAQSIYNYLRHSSNADTVHICKSYAVIPLHADCGADIVADCLLKAFSSMGNAHRLRIPHESAQTTAATNIEEEIRRLDDLERNNNFLIFETELDLTPWTLKAVHQSDQIIFVAAGHAHSQLTDLEQQFAKVPGFEMKRKHLVLLHPENATRPAEITPWRLGRDIERIYPLRKNNPGDFSRLARFLTDSAVGVVLGGGGARGFAHIGVLKALEEVRYPVDLLGGNSMGALIAALYATDTPLEEISARIQAFARGGEYPTLPLVSLLSGRRMERDLKKMFGETKIDMLWRPFFAAACNLSQADTMVQESGLLWRAVMASNSPAGLLPPVVHNGDLLVDGAILDNVPVAAMRSRLGTPLEKRRGNGTIIAVDVDVQDDLSVPREVSRLSPWGPLKALLRLGDNRSPGIGDILYRAGHIGSLERRSKTIALADHYLAPPVASFPLMGYRQANAIIEVGYRYAANEIERWNCH